MSFKIDYGNALDFYTSWDTPTVIVSDGPYGVGGYEGDPRSVDDLPNMYEPHVCEWARRAEPNTVLWFWNTEIGWATVHPILRQHGWIYHGCNIWNKGLKHIAGNCNGKTMRQFPVVTEMCVQYVRQPYLKKIDEGLTAQQWFRSEWLRTGLPLNRANEACGVKNAATRKYFTSDSLFYPPPPDVFAKLVQYANLHGDRERGPYFSIPQGLNLKEKGYWYRFNFEYGVSNVWDEPALRGKERIKCGGKSLHLSQKPLRLMERIISASSDTGDVIWEPFGGLCTASLSANRLGRNSYAAEIIHKYHSLAVERLNAG